MCSQPEVLHHQAKDGTCVQHDFFTQAAADEIEMSPFLSFVPPLIVHVKSRHGDCGRLGVSDG